MSNQVMLYVIDIAKLVREVIWSDKLTAVAPVHSSILPLVALLKMLSCKALAVNPEFKFCARTEPVVLRLVLFVNGRPLICTAKLPLPPLIALTWKNIVTFTILPTLLY